MLTGKQRSYLKSLANGIDSIFQVGKGNINDNMIKQLNDVLIYVLLGASILTLIAQEYADTVIIIAVNVIFFIFNTPSIFIFYYFNMVLITKVI